MPILLISNIVPGNKTPEQEFLKTYPREKLSVAFFSSKHDPSRKYFDLLQAHYSEFQIKKWIYVELDYNFDPDIVNSAFHCDLIYLSGGCTPYFLQNILKRKINTRLKEFEQNGGLLIGLSAGAILLGPSLEIAFDDPSEVAAAKNLESTNGLNLYSFEFFPHFRSESEQISFVKKRFLVTGRPILSCPDGAGVIINGSDIKIIGPAEWIKN